jgi:hypothetical protein
VEVLFEGLRRSSFELAFIQCIGTERGIVRADKTVGGIASEDGMLTEPALFVNMKQLWRIEGGSLVLLRDTLQTFWSRHPQSKCK